MADYETGLNLVRPLMQDSILLANCSIRLCFKTDSGLQKLARATVFASTTENTVPVPEGAFSTPFRFQDLPLELRYRILSFTDLATPFQEVEWHPEHGMYWRIKPRGFLSWHNPSIQHGAFDFHAQQVAPPRHRTEEHWTVDYKRTPSCWEMSHPCGCFCKAYHAAYSTMHQCNCWAPPKALFLVSKAMRHESSKVFFNSNRIIVTSPGNERWLGVESAPVQLAATIFFNTAIAKEMLYHLRFLEIVLPPFGIRSRCPYCPVDSVQWRTWIQTIEYMKEHLDLSKLTIRLWFAAWLPENRLSVPKYREEMDEAESRTIEETYMNIVEPLRRLQGLRQFFADFTDPMWWTADESYRGRKAHFRALEDRAEKTVMGEHYDGIASGKQQITESRWEREHMIRGDGIAGADSSDWD